MMTIAAIERHVALVRLAVCVVIAAAAFAAAAQERHMPVRNNHNITDTIAESPDSVVVQLGDAQLAASLDQLPDSVLFGPEESPYDRWEPRDTEFNPDPTRAVWMSALFPGLGQLYNRRYWKLPIVIGAYMGLGYATSWNNTMLSDYTKAYRDIMDNDPDTKSYMDFFPPNVQESDLDRTWLTNVLQSRKKLFQAQPRPLYHSHGGCVSGSDGRRICRCIAVAFRHNSRPLARLVAGRIPRRFTAEAGSGTVVGF